MMCNMSFKEQGFIPITSTFKGMGINGVISL